MSTRNTVYLLSAFAVLASGCPDNSVEPAPTTGTTTAIVVTTADENSTAPTTDAVDSTSTGASTGTSDTGATTEEPLSCGEPAAECTNARRVWCEDFADMCLLAGLSVTDTNYCAILSKECPTEPACQGCFNLANTCKQVGIVTPAECEIVFADCLCRAAALGLNINA